MNSKCCDARATGIRYIAPYPLTENPASIGNAIFKVPDKGSAVKPSIERASP